MHFIIKKLPAVQGIFKCPDTVAQMCTAESGQIKRVSQTHKISSGNSVREIFLLFVKNEAAPVLRKYRY